MYSWHSMGSGYMLNASSYCPANSYVPGTKLAFDQPDNPQQSRDGVPCTVGSNSSIQRGTELRWVCGKPVQSTGQVGLGLTPANVGLFTH
jgi:hypothetical protein